MNLIKSPSGPGGGSITANNTPVKKDKNEFSSLGGSSEVIPKGPDLFRSKSNGFQGFREHNDSPRKGSSRKIIQEDDDEPWNGDSLNRDDKDMERERMKTAEEVRIEEELAAEVNRIKLKRTHSTTSLKPPPTGNSTPPGNTPQLGAPSFTASTPKAANKAEPETPAKRRRGSQDADVKSPPPAVPSRGIGFAPPEETPQYSFGGFLSGGTSNAMDEEEL